MTQSPADISRKTTILKMVLSKVLGLLDQYSRSTPGSEQYGEARAAINSLLRGAGMICVVQDGCAQIREIGVDHDLWIRADVGPGVVIGSKINFVLEDPTLPYQSKFIAVLSPDELYTGIVTGFPLEGMVAYNSTL